MKLSQIVAEYLGKLPAGIVLEESQVSRNLRKAVRLYCGYATLRSAPSPAELFISNLTSQGLCAPLFPVGDVHTPIDATDGIADNAQDFDLSPSELAIIGPLWRLYNEDENAVSLEASRALGLDVYGRNTDSIAMDIKEYELSMPDRCFMEGVVSIR